jgi:adenylyltransferase/sulfurtransferase
MPHDAPLSADLTRYARQTRFAPLGDEGQRRLAQSAALLCGCGALGSSIANVLVRAGVGMLRIVDRDFVEVTNLQRQSLFDEADAAAGTPKAIAAAEKLRAINSTVSIEPIVADIDPDNIGRLCEGIDVILDGTDNFETRFLINDLAVSRRLPWVYGGCVGAEGQSMTILPGETPCLGCLMPECPAPGSLPTCETAGILGPIVGLIASIEAAEALKLLSGNRAAISRSLTVVDLWPETKPRSSIAPDNAPGARDAIGATAGRGFMPMFRQIDVRGLRERVDCPTCRRGEFPWLSGRLSSRTAVLCGRNAVQLGHPGASLPLDQLAARLEGVAQILARNQFLLRVRIEGYELTLFPDARAIISGTDDPAAAKAVYAKYVGN